MADIQEVYWIKIFYSGLMGNYKVSPVLVLNNLGNGRYTIAEITSVPPKDPPGHYDNYKEPIINWVSCGLDKPSYVKCKNIHNVEDVRFIKLIGIMDADDFLNIVIKISEYN